MISGERVAERLKALGLSQGELARRVGVSQPTIFKLIHENKSGSRSLHKVARELGTTAAYLTCETDDPSGERTDEQLTSEEREWVELLRTLPTADRRATVRLLRLAVAGARLTTVGAKPMHEIAG